MASPSGPTDPAELVALEEARRRGLKPTRNDELINELQGDETVARCRERLWDELEEFAS